MCLALHIIGKEEKLFIFMILLLFTLSGGVNGLSKKEFCQNKPGKISEHLITYLYAMPLQLKGARQTFKQKC